MKYVLYPFLFTSENYDFEFKTFDFRSPIKLFIVVHLK